MEFVDKELARRFESAEEVPQLLYAELYRKTRPESGTSAQPISGGHMIFAGLNSPMGRVVGAGLRNPLTEAEVDEIEAVYNERSAPSKIDVCPMHPPETIEMLKGRGYVMEELNQVLYRKLTPGESFDPVPEGVTIRRGEFSEAAQFATIVGRSFHEGKDLPEGFTEMMTPLFQFEGATPFVAELGGEAVAAAAGLLIPEHRIYAMFGAGTLPEFRRRGLQSALIAARLRLASEAGAEYAVVVTQGGTVSQRNAQRVGFTVAYSKATVVKPFARA